VISSETTAHSARTKLGAALLLSLLVLAAGGKSVLFDTLDPDCFWHLRVADQLAREGVHPLVDDLSFASIKEPWTPYSWLAELGMKWIWDHAGMRGVVASEAIIVAAFFTFIALAAFERSKKYFTSCVLTFLAIVLCLPYLSFRPVTMCLTLLALCWWLLMKDQRRAGNGVRHYFHSGDAGSRRKWCLTPFSVWLVVPITAININIHFFAAFVPLWIGCLLISNRRYLPLFIATSLACLATPMLPGMIKTIVHYQFGDPMLHAGVIAEFEPIYVGALGLSLTAIVLCLLICAIRRRSELSRGEWIALLISTALLLKLGRFSPLFSIVAIPLLSAAAPTLRDHVLGKPLVRAVLSLCVVLALAKISLALPHRTTTADQWINRHGPDVPGYPVEATNFVAQHITPQSHHLINEFTWGGYVEWKLGERFQVLMDGRTQLYTPRFWHAMYVDPKERLTSTLSGIEADAAIVPADRSRLRESLVASGWRRAFKDDRAEVLVPPTSAFATIDEDVK
jgi:hypothetical protein